jgi:hypothetical protein
LYEDGEERYASAHKFRKRFMSSEETKSPIRVRRENIHLAWVSVSFV